MKNFFEAGKEFCIRHFKQVTFVIFAAVGTILALLTNYAHNQGYGNILQSGDAHHRTHYYNENRERHDSTRKPWTMQKPSSKSSSERSNSSGRK